MAGVVTAAVAVAFDQHLVGWLAVGLLAVSLLWRLVHRRRQSASLLDGASHNDDS